MELSLLTIICPPSLERPITDWLLEQEMITGFTSLEVHGHGSRPESLSLIEQVEGRKKQTMFQIHMGSDIETIVIDNLKRDFNGTDIHYWTTPIIATGNLLSDN
jgi:hypothetical protein